MANDLHELDEWLSRLAAEGATVTVVLDSGKSHTGTLHAHPTDPIAYVVRTGRRGRPAVVYVDEVEEVIPE